MKLPKSILPFLSVLVVAALLLSACGGSRSGHNRSRSGPGH